MKIKIIIIILVKKGLQFEIIIKIKFINIIKIQNKKKKCQFIIINRINKFRIIIRKN